MEKIVLNKIIIEKNVVKYVFYVSENLKKYFTSYIFFIEYEEDISEVPISILSIPFVNCMAGLSWLSGAMLFVDEIDATYYESYKQLKSAYSELHNTQLKGVFVPSVIVRNEIKKTNEYLLLFGGGVDCHSSLLRNKQNINGLVNIYGWLKSEDETNNVDESDKQQTKEVADRFGIESYHARSNFASQFNSKEVDILCQKIQTSYWYGFLHPMAFLSISVPIAWVKGISNLMIASSFTKDRADVHCGSFITTDSEFRFAVNGSTLHDGFELNRQDKVKILADYQKQIGRPYLIQACSFNDHNCCECEKCFRTIIELIAENANPIDFGFNINDSVKQHWGKIINRDVGLWGVSKENYYYYYYARIRMKENYANIKDKEFVDWFLNFDFEKAKKEGLKRYYRQNFFSILKRKLHL